MICVIEEGQESRVDWLPALEHARAQGGCVAAWYVRRQDLGHYGRVDHLAPAGDCATFEAYVMAQDAEQAEACFAPLRAGLGNMACTVRVIYGKEALTACLAAVHSPEVKVFSFM